MFKFPSTLTWEWW